MVRAVQLQQTKKHGKVRTTGTAGLRPDRHQGARSSVSCAKRLAVIDGGINFFFVNMLHAHAPISSSCSVHVIFRTSRFSRVDSQT